jgi:hypothetical protein
MKFALVSSLWAVLCVGGAACTVVTPPITDECAEDLDCKIIRASGTESCTVSSDCKADEACVNTHSGTHCILHSDVCPENTAQVSVAEHGGTGNVLVCVDATATCDIAAKACL